MLTEGEINIISSVAIEVRFCVIRIGDLFLGNDYLPCVGTTDGNIICNSTLLNIWSCRELYPECECIITGDCMAFGDNKDASRRVNGISDDKMIVSNSAEYFYKCCSSISVVCSDTIYL